MNNEKLIDLREEKYLLQKKGAKKIGVVESVYSEWENGKLSIPTKRLVKLANLFEVNINYMVGISNIRTKIKSNNTIDTQ